jgi:hypothetical protein
MIRKVFLWLPELSEQDYFKGGKPLCPKNGCGRVTVRGYALREAWFGREKVHILYCRYQCLESLCQSPVTVEDSTSKKHRRDIKNEGMKFCLIAR